PCQRRRLVIQKHDPPCLRERQVRLNRARIIRKLPKYLAVSWLRGIGHGGLRKKPCAPAPPQDTPPVRIPPRKPPPPHGRKTALQRRQPRPLGVLTVNL